MEVKKKGEKHQHGLERFISLNVRPWLLEFSSQQEAQNLFKGDKWILKEAFYSLELLNPAMNGVRSLICTNAGVIQLMHIFIKIDRFVGEVMKVDEEAISRRSLHFVKMLVEVEAVKPVTQRVRIRAGDTVFSIVIKECNENKIKERRDGKY